MKLPSPIYRLSVRIILIRVVIIIATLTVFTYGARNYVSTAKAKNYVSTAKARNYVSTAKARNYVSTAKARNYVSTAKRLHNSAPKYIANLSTLVGTLKIYIQPGGWVSEEIKRYGVFEEEDARQFENYLVKNPDVDVLDIGSQIGQYTLIAAAHKRRVIALEADRQVAQLFKKSLMINDLQDRVLLVNRVLDDTRNNFYFPAGMRVLNVSRQNRPGSIQSILMDDLVDLIDREWDGTISIHMKKIDRLMLKMDIEGSEIYAVRQCTRFFNRFRVNPIMMEWSKVRNIKKHANEIIRVFSRLGYVPQKRLDDKSTVLNKANNYNWGENMFWVKN